MRLDMKMLADGLVEIVKGYVATAKDGLSARIDDLQKTIDSLPAPKDGERGRDGIDGKDGKDAEPLDLKSVVAEVLEKMPAPAPGKDGKDGQKGADGRSFTIEEAKSLLDAHLARWELDFERRATDALQRSIDRVEKPKDGVNGVDGKDGIDGLGFDDLTVEHDGERGFKFMFTKGDRVKSFDFSVPVVLDRGFYREGDAFEKGDGVTFGGSYWISQTFTRTKPEIGNADWRLAVKKGRDAKASVEIGK